MSIDPGTMQQMLMQQLQQGPQAGTAGGGMGGPQMQGQVSPMNAASSLVQKVMLMRALNQPAIQQQQANAMLPKTNSMMAQDPSMQALQQTPQLPPLDMGTPAIPPPFAQPTPGFS
jgi:hypothetical protein